MNAYDRALALERRAAQSRVAIGILVALGILTAATLIFRAGRGAAKRDDEAHQAAVIHDTIVKELHTVELRLRVDTVRVRVAEQKAIAASAAFDSAAARVVAVADTAKMIPATLVLPEIQLCKELRDAQLEQIDGLKVTVRDLDEDRTLEKRRADLAELQLKKLKPSRFGFRTGVTAGAALVAIVIHLVR